MALFMFSDCDVLSVPCDHRRGCVGIVAQSVGKFCSQLFNSGKFSIMILIILTIVGKKGTFVDFVVSRVSF